MARDRDKLIEEAKRVRSKAYAPYSGFYVGVALFDESGRLHVGCNVENSSFPEGSCAETGAIAAMVAAGGKRIAAIACIGGRDEPEDCTPCGGCRQRINEFADENTRVILVNGDGEVYECAIAELLPSGFRLGR